MPHTDTVIHHDRAALVAAHERASGWAEHGYSPESRLYWAGMRDTLAVVLGLTTRRPTSTGPDTDVAATEMVPACLPIPF